MKERIKRSTPLFLFIILILSLTVLHSPVGRAQIGEGVATGDTEVEPGAVIDRDPVTNSFSLSQRSSSQDIFGVIVERPAVSIQTGGQVSLVQTGQTEVRVSTYNGSIVAGDLLTSSPLPGVGMKADEEHDYILGVALRDFAEEEAGETVEFEGRSLTVGRVLTDLRIGYRGLLDDLPEEEREEEVSFMEAHFEDLIIAAIRYLLAAIIALGSLFGAYKLFQNNLSGGVVALGRNPMAQAPIKRMMVMNVVVVIVIAMGGLALAAFMVWM